MIKVTLMQAVGYAALTISAVILYETLAEPGIWLALAALALNQVF